MQLQVDGHEKEQLEALIFNAMEGLFDLVQFVRDLRQGVDHFYIKFGTVEVRIKDNDPDADDVLILAANATRQDGDVFYPA